MFELTTPLDQMTLDELELTRSSWIKEIEPLAIETCRIVLTNSDPYTIYGRMTWEIAVPDALFLRAIRGEQTFRPSDRMYVSEYTLQVYHQNNHLLNLTFVFCGSQFEKVAEIQPYHFCRPGLIDWTTELQKIVDFYRTKERQRQNEQEEAARLELLSLLTTGVYNKRKM